MKTVEFCYWLQGLFELQPEVLKKGLSPEQTLMVQRHLALVFQHEIDPLYSSDDAAKAARQALHDGKATFNPKPRSKKSPRMDGGPGGYIPPPVYTC